MCIRDSITTPAQNTAARSCAAAFATVMTSAIPVSYTHLSAPPLALAIGALGAGTHMVQPILQIARDGSCLARARDAPVSYTHLMCIRDRVMWRQISSTGVLWVYAAAGGF